MLELIIQFLTQIGGGPGAAENNLVRFGLPAIFWAVLALVAWSRQRQEQLPRERLLLFGFGLFFARELFMFLHTAERLFRGPASVEHVTYIEPLEHALAVSAMLVICAAFIRYMLDDVTRARRYLLAGLAAVAAGVALSFALWPQQLAANPQLHFHDTAGAWFMHLTKVVFIGAAIVILVRYKGWERNVVIVALSFLLFSVLLTLFNTLTDRTYDYFLCPISNNLHIWAVPIFGFVYFREQSLAKKQAESELSTYRKHLERLVEQRTADLSSANTQLQLEVEERARAESAIAERNAALSAQNRIAATISHSLNLDEILRAALEQTLALLDLVDGCVLLLDGAGELSPQLCCSRSGKCSGIDNGAAACACSRLAWQAIESNSTLVSQGDVKKDGRSLLLLSVPLEAHGKTLGAVTVYGAENKQVTSSQQALLTAIGQQIGIAIENARLYQDSEAWAAGMSRLHDMSLQQNALLEPAELCQIITRQAVELLGCSAAGLFQLDDNGAAARGVASCQMVNGGVEGMSLPLAGNALLHDLLHSGEPLIVVDVRRDGRIPAALWQTYPMRALLGVPVRGSTAMQGFLFLVEARHARDWQPDEVRLLVNFANRAGAAWENACLQKQLAWAAALEERQRIAADMHDGLAQTISTLALRNDQAAQMVEKGDGRAALRELATIQEIIAHAGGDLRRSIASLQSSPRPRCSLQENLAGLAQVSAADTPEITFKSTLAEPLYLPPTDMDQIVHVVEEALLNAHRHAQAGHVTLRLADRGSCYSLAIEDDGCGFDLASVTSQQGHHFGLRIMRARAERIGGELAIVTAPGEGTRLQMLWAKGANGDTLDVDGLDQQAVENLLAKGDLALWQN